MSLLREFVFSNCGCGGSGATETLRTAYTGSVLDDAAWMSVPCEQLACVTLRKMTPATLAAMDAAAEVMARHKPVDPILVQEMPSFGDADFCLWGVTVRLSVEEEAELLRILLERAIQRRKETGNG